MIYQLIHNDRAPLTASTPAMSALFIVIQRMDERPN